MQYKSYAVCAYKKELKDIYEKSFPKNEKFPFWVLKRCAKESNVCLDAIVDPVTTIIVGMRFLVYYDDIAYLMYFAIDEQYRNKGYGSLVLRDLINSDNVVLLCIEQSSNESEVNDIKSRRKNFYLRNGFYATGCNIEDSGVVYEVLSSSRERIVSEDDLEKRYSSMSQNPLMRFIINHTFDKNINFCD